MSADSLPVYRCPLSGAEYFVARKSADTFGIFTRSPFVNGGRTIEFTKAPVLREDAVREIGQLARSRGLVKREKLSL